MLSRQKQKALIEAMLFVSTVPVPIAKILRKLKHANRIDAKLQENPDQDVEALQEDGQEAESSINETIETQSDEMLLDEAEVIEIHHDDIAETIDTLSAQSEAQNDNAAEDEVENAETGHTDEERDEAVQENANQDDVDIMSQLLQKQQELEQDLSVSDIKSILVEIEDELKNEDRGLELVVVAKGYQIRTKYDVSVYLREEKVKVPQRFSPSSLETLAIVAYQQPITRQRVEDIRGVDSGGVIKTLLDKGILRVVGRSDEPGKPLIYGTSRKFLEVFGLKTLRDLPSLQDFHALQTSQDRQVDDEMDMIQDSDEDVNRIRVDDLLETTYQEMDEADQIVLEGLDESLSELKRVEKDVLEASQPADEIQTENAESSMSVATDNDSSSEQTSST